jgi:hypothetical protein
VIGKVVTGSDVRGLVRYLYGPGRANEHTDPHLTGAWTDPQRVEPVPDERGRRDLGRLVALLEAPLAASVRVPEVPVWHCALRAAPADRRLSDAEWDDVAREVLDRTGLAPRGDTAGCRWVAVRHAEDQLHLVVTLARQDGRAVSTFRDFYRVEEACRAVEDRYGLTVTPARDRTAAKRATRAETEKAHRTGRVEPPRLTLAREVRYAAVAAATEDEFFTGLRAAGVLVRPRYSERTPGQVTGYAVALLSDRATSGEPVWFGGGKLAPDLTWPQLQHRWADGAAAPEQPLPRAAAYQAAAAVVRGAAADLHQSTSGDPASRTDVIAATSDLMVVTARVVEGRRPGGLTAAADHFDRAWREPHRRPSPDSRSGRALRDAARILARATPPRPGDGRQLVALIDATVSLIEAVAELRAAQHRDAQAAAAHRAAVSLTAHTQALRAKDAVGGTPSLTAHRSRRPPGPSQMPATSARSR